MLPLIVELLTAAVELLLTLDDVLVAGALFELSSVVIFSVFVGVTVGWIVIVVVGVSVSADVCLIF